MITYPLEELLVWPVVEVLQDILEISMYLIY